MVSLQNQIRWCTRAQWALCIVIVLSLGAFYLLGYRPITHDLADSRTECAQVQQELDDASSKAGVLTEVAQEVKSLRIKLEGSKKLPHENDLAQFIKDITQLSQQTSLKTFRIRPDPPIRGELFSQRPIKLTFDGDFLNVYSFLRQTEAMQRLTRTPAARISNKENKPGVVSVELSMNLYFSPDD
jgi:Tfp pilus assembly protein PilO